MILVAKSKVLDDFSPNFNKFQVFQAFGPDPRGPRFGGHEMRTFGSFGTQILDPPRDQISGGLVTRTLTFFDGHPGTYHIRDSKNRVFCTFHDIL